MITPSQITYLPTSQIQPNPLQPRGVIAPDSILDLVESIKEHGILEPIVVAHTPAGYQIIAGERRWRAAKMTGLETVPCIIKETTPRKMLEMAIVENVQREDLNALERAEAFNRLSMEFQLTPTDISKQIGKSNSYVTNTLKLLDLPDALKDGLLSGLISECHARALQGIPNKSRMIEGYKQVLKENASVRRAEEIARKMRAEIEGTGQNLAVRDDKIVYREDIEKIRQEILSSLGEKSAVRLTQSQRQTRLLIVLNGTPEKVKQDLEKIYQSIVDKKPAMPISEDQSNAL